MATDIKPTGRDEGLQAAYMTLLVGGIAGALIVIASVISGYWWWHVLIAWLRDGTTEKLWEPAAAVVAQFIGLGIMFASFQSARRFERVDSTLRRVLYGYNTGLQLYLMLAVLVIVVLAVSFMKPLPYDATEAGFFSVNEKTQRFISELETPVNIYLVMDQSNPAFGDVVTMLAHMETINPRFFHFEELTLSGDRTRAQDLMKRFKQFNPRTDGLLVTYGDKPEQNHSYIPEGELSNFEMGGDPRNPHRSFNGEVRLMQELQFLAEDKHRPVIYFTQGHGELDIMDRASPDGMADLFMKLGKANFDVRPLTASSPDVNKNQVPPDADVVVIVGPKSSMGDMIPGLRKYMQAAGEKKGKLVVLLGPTPPDPANKNMMRDTGLEPFLAEFGVTVTKDKIYQFLVDQAPVNNPEVVLVAAPTADISSHPISAMFKNMAVPFIDVRRLEAAAKSPDFKVEPLLNSYRFTWVESDMSKPIGPLFSRMRQGADLEGVSNEPRLVLAAVSESKPQDPHSGGAERRATPRMIVAGCSSIATNRMQRVQTQAMNFDLIRSSIDWCRERSANVGIEPKTYQYYSLPKQSSNWNLFYLPMAAMLLGVFALGLIVWNVRRT